MTNWYLRLNKFYWKIIPPASINIDYDISLKFNFGINFTFIYDYN